MRASFTQLGFASGAKALAQVPVENARAEARASLRSEVSNAEAEASAYLEQALSVAETFPQGLKPSDVSAPTAWLKPRPFKARGIAIPPFPQRTRKGWGTPALLLIAATSTLFVAGCRQDMHNQPKFIPQRGTEFFADHRSARPQVENTVARGALHEDSYFYTGTVLGANGYREEKDMLPFPATMTVLQKGEERFNIYCTPCHSRVGNGLGAIVQRGYKPAGNLNDEVRRAQPLSHYFYVMSHGYGAMPDYSAQLSPEERWAVAAYIRALQLSQNATEKDVASGAKVDTLKNVAAAKGLPEGFAGPWDLPTTAISARPQKTDEGTPAMGPADGVDPKVFIPHAAAPAGSKTNSSKPTSTPAASTAGNQGAGN
jgi:mono/diheme cytochrome c family protein